MKKRVFSILLSCVMLAGLIPTTPVYAEGDTATTAKRNIATGTNGISDYDIANGCVFPRIADDNNAVLYYGQIANNKAFGTASVTVPADLEQYNSSNKANYASNFEGINSTVENTERFSLNLGDTYYFDLSGEKIPGKANTSLPDTTLHYVPFTYVGEVKAYKLVSEMRTTEAYAQQNEYSHNLFVADYVIMHTTSWNKLNIASLIFGKDYTSGNVNYTLRTPSTGSKYTGSGDSERGTPTNNEWDMILNKDIGYIKNWSKMYSWGQDTITFATVYRSFRGYDSVRKWSYKDDSLNRSDLGFRPVLEVLNADALGFDGLKAVTLDLCGGKLGDSFDDIQVIVKNDSTFTAPAADGLTAPIGYSTVGLKWKDSNENLYAPGDSVPAGVAKLTAQWALKSDYTVQFDANGGSAVENKTNVKWTDKVLDSVNAPTRNGYEFAGWKCGDITATDETTYSDLAKQDTVTSVTLTAQWTVKSGYTVEFDANGGSTIESKTNVKWTDKVLNSVTAPTRNGYEFAGWKCGDITVTDETTYSDLAKQDTVTSVTLTAQWTVKSGYTVEFDANGGSTIESKTNVKWTDKVLNSVTAPTRNGYDFAGWKCGDTTVTDETTYADLAKQDTVTSVTLTAQWDDIEAPTGEIKIATNNWYKFLNTISFGIFFNETQEVVITADDNSQKPVTVEYYLGDRAYTEAELENVDFTKYNAPFSISPDNKYVVYARLTDESGNIGYISTNGIVLDATPPVISGITDGKVYCEKQTVTVTDDYLHGVYVNDELIYPDKDGKFHLNPAEVPQKIVAYDKASNTAEMTVTVNDGHTYEWQNDNGQYWQKCKYCNHETEKTSIPQITINGADKVCRTQDYTYSFTLPEGCSALIVGYEFERLGGDLDATLDNGVYTVTLKSSGYVDEENSFKVTVSAETADGYRFKAEKTVEILNAHTGGTATCTEKAECEICHEKYGELNPDNHTGTADWQQTATTHEKKWSCCGETVVASENHKWKDGVCEECGYSCQHTGGTATCTEKAECEICHEKYGELNPDNHTGTADWKQTATTHEKKWGCCGETVVASENHKWKNGVCEECGYSCQHTGGTATCTEKAECEVCGEKYGELNPDNHTGTADWKQTATTHEKKWSCCGETVVASENHKWKDGICEECGYSCQHTGGTATCTEKAECEICHEKYGELNPKNHADLKHIDAKIATVSSEGNIEYWYCQGCNKYYSDSQASKEITKADTVISKLTEAPKSPQTGNSTTLWFVLLFIGGGAITGAVVYVRRKHFKR